LAYQGQRETDYERATRKCRKIVQRLGGDPDDDNWPEKPKGMHWKTYDRLLAEAQYYDEMSYQALQELFAKYTSA
jgi:GTP cyclohydrolase I